MAYFRSDIDIIEFLLGYMKMSGSAGLFNKNFFLPRREPKGGRSGRWKHKKQYGHPYYDYNGNGGSTIAYI